MQTRKPRPREFGKLAKPFCSSEHTILIFATTSLWIFVGFGFLLFLSFLFAALQGMRDFPNQEPSLVPLES